MYPAVKSTFNVLRQRYLCFWLHLIMGLRTILSFNRIRTLCGEAYVRINSWIEDCCLRRMVLELDIESDFLFPSPVERGMSFSRTLHCVSDLREMVLHWLSLQLVPEITKSTGKGVRPDTECDNHWSYRILDLKHLEHTRSDVSRRAASCRMWYIYRSHVPSRNGMCYPHAAEGLRCPEP